MAEHVEENEGNTRSSPEELSLRMNNTTSVNMKQEAAKSKGLKQRDCEEGCGQQSSQITGASRSCQVYKFCKLRTSRRL
jgi:hypothetical protein